MTIKEFLELIEPGGWHLDGEGCLSDENDNCPLWHLYYGSDCYAYSDEEAFDYLEAGMKCGLRERDAIAIAQAADNRGHPRLRKRLLARVGLAKA